jgi:hypothetical protein
MRKKRGVDVEPVFGHIKTCRGFQRFMLRSLAKVNIEFGLLAIAHNIKKWWTKIQTGAIIRGLGPQNNPNQPKVALILAFSSHQPSQITHG